MLDPVDTEKYETILLPRKEKWGLLILENSVLAKKDVITKEDFANVPLLISKRPEIQRMFADWLGIKKGAVADHRNVQFDFQCICAN